MPEIKIGVSAGVQGVDAAIQKITSSMNKLGAAVSANQKLRFEPTDVKLMARDLALVNKQFQQTIALSSQLRNALKATGQSGAHISQVDFSKLSANPQVAQRLRDRAFMNTVRGTSLDPTLANDVDANGNAVAPGAGGGAGTGAGSSGGGSGGSGGGGGGGGGRRPTRSGGGSSGGAGGGGGGGPWWSRRPSGGIGPAAAMAIGNGIGGPVGGMITGFMDGGLLGAGLSGLTSVVGAGMEGMTQARARNVDLDTLKRSMGDLGVAFSDLSEQSWKFAGGLGMANGEFVKLEGQANAQSGGYYRTPEDLARATRGGADLGRAYGLDPSQGVSFVAGMQRINSRQNNKELAVQIAEAISHTQSRATPAEVMQAMQGFASQQNAFNSGSVDLNRFGNAYSSLLGSDGMTADHASSILGTANASMQHMGGTEASRNFTMQAFGNLDPIRAAMRAEGGLFGNGLNNSDISGYMSAHGIANWDSQGTGPSGTNFDVVKGAFDKAYGGRGQYGTEMELDAEKNYFGLRSYGDTASFMNMTDPDRNRTLSAIKNAGVNLGDVREGGLSTVSSIANAGTFDDLDKLYRNSIRGRPDMQRSDIDAMDKAEGSNNFQQFQNELIRVMSGKGQEDTQATIQRNIDSTLTNIETKIGDGLLPIANTSMQALLKMVGMAGPAAAVSGGGAPYGYGLGPSSVAGSKGIVVQPGGSSAAAGGSTVGGAGNARDMRGHADNSGDSAAAWANGMYGSMVGDAYSANSNVVDGMRQIMGAGVDKAHASAIMASAIRESSMDPAAGNVGSYGLFQFDKSRAADFQKVMHESLYGSSQHDQIEYMMRSMKKGGEEAGPGAEFFASNGKDAARVFSNKVERPKEKSKEADIRSGIADSLNGSDIVINLHQTVGTPGGGQKTKKISTKVPLPTASGAYKDPIIMEVPGS